MSTPPGAPDERATPPSPRRDLATPLGLAAMTVAFVVFAAHYVPRLTNAMWADSEFTGWSAAIARRMVAGEVLYRDLVLPMPPGSMWLLAAIQRATGHARVIHEVAVCAACHLLMGLLAWAIARPLASRLGALFVGASTLALVVQLPKELAYDHTAQVVAWASFALVARALTADAAASRARFAAAAGVVAGLVLVFKQSTFAGAAAGGALALAVGALLASGPLRPRIAPVAAFVGATLAGVVGSLALVAASGAPVVAMLRLAFVEGSKLKGGREVLLGRLAGYFVVAPTIQLPLVSALLGLALAARLARRDGAFVVPDRDEARAQSIRPLELAGFAAIVATASAVGVALLRSHELEVPTALQLVTVLAVYAAPIGLLVGGGYLLSARRAGATSRTVALGALVVGALAESAFHNASVPEVRIFYDNNAIVPVSLLALFVALERARATAWRWALFAVLALSWNAGKLSRWLVATEPGGDGFWAGMRVSGNGVAALQAAARADALAGPSGTALVLPEDLDFAALLRARRPKLCGAVLFVDQYPERCFAGDLASLETSLPDVIVHYPRRTEDWQRMYRLWNAHSPAGLLNEALLGYHLPRSYRLDSSYDATYWGGADHIDVYVRDDDAHRARGAEDPPAPSRGVQDAADREPPPEHP